MIRFLFQLIPLVCLLLPGCRSLRNEVDPSQLGLNSSKLVVSGFLSPQDTTLAVKVTHSSTVVGDSLSLFQTGDNITNATVTLSEGGRAIVLRYNNRSVSSDSAQPYYSANARLLPIVAGKTYTLTVVTPAGQRASSVCTIPKAIQPMAVTLDSLKGRYLVRVRWQDPAGQANYYQVTGIFRYISNCPTCQDEAYNGLLFDDDNRGLFSDAGRDGTPIESGRAYLTSTSGTGNQQADFNRQYKTATVTVNLLTIDEAYFRYQEAIIRQRRSRNNPFAEPVPIPSNIEAGLGCFAGYNNSILTLKLK